jgi:DNA polymerase-3 subunit gamma/tau
LARAVNCQKPDGGDPCGKCENCLEINRGGSMDIIEIDAASNRGIDDVRLLKDRAFLLPSKLKKKVIIIDEVHMLTKEAFNALLKLIEEPPAHTIFVLCTTDPQKIPDTVLSRLTRVDFRKGSRKELESSLKRIIDGEKISVENGVIDLLIDKSDGSFRNLQRTFNEIFMDLGKDLKLGEVQKYFEKRKGDYSEVELERDLVTGETGTILERLEKMAESGVDFSYYRQSFMSYLQKKWLAIWDTSMQRSELSRGDLERLIALLVEAGRWEKETEISQLPLEMALVKFTDKNEVNPGSKDKPAVEKKGEEKQVKVEIEAKTEEKEVKSDPDEIVIIKKDIATDLKVEDLESKWNEVLIAVKPFNHSVEAFLRATRPKRIEGNLVTLEVYYPFHKERLEEARNRKIVESGLDKVFGEKLVIECTLAKGKKPPIREMEVAAVSDGAKTEEGQKPSDNYDVAKEIFG